MVASAVGIYLTEAQGAFGATWSAPITFAVAAGVYGIALEFAHASWFRMARPNDPRSEIDDVWEARVRCTTCDKSYIALEMDRDPGASHEAICASCAAGARFFRDARAESRRAQGDAGTETPSLETVTPA